MSFVQAGLIRVNDYMVDFTEADFTLKCNRVKSRCLFNYLPIDNVIKLLVFNAPNVFT